MSLLDKAKDLLRGHKQQADAGVDKAGDMADEKTGGKYDAQIDKGAETVKERLPGEEGGTTAGPTPT